MVIPAGKLSVKSKSVTPSAAVLLILNVKVETLPGPISVKSKDLLNVGGVRFNTSTSSVAVFPPRVYVSIWTPTPAVAGSKV